MGGSGKTSATIHFSTNAVFLIITAASNEVNGISHCGGCHVTALQGHCCSGHPLMGVGGIIDSELTLRQGYSGGNEASVSHLSAKQEEDQELEKHQMLR